MKKYLILGGNSLSGSNFSYHLSKNKNNKIININRSKPNLIYNKYLYHKIKTKDYNYNLVKDYKQIIKTIESEKPDYIINFVSQSMVSQSWERPEDWFELNSYYLPKLYFDLSNFDFLKKIIHFSTPEVYGSTKINMSENNDYDPSTPYGVSRVTADHTAKMLFNSKNLKIITTRASNVYGEHQKIYRIIPLTIYKILMNEKIYLHGGGVSKRDFIYSNDVSSALSILLKRGIDGEIYHISNNTLITIKNLVKNICKVMNVDYTKHIISVNDRLGKDKIYSLSNNKIRQLGWKPRTNLDQGILKVIKWTKNNFDSIKKLDAKYTHKR